MVLHAPVVVVADAAGLADHQVGRSQAFVQGMGWLVHGVRGRHCRPVLRWRGRLRNLLHGGLQPPAQAFAREAGHAFCQHANVAGHLLAPWQPRRLGLARIFQGSAGLLQPRIAHDHRCAQAHHFALQPLQLGSLLGHHLTATCLRLAQLAAQGQKLLRQCVHAPPIQIRIILILGYNGQLQKQVPGGRTSGDHPLMSACEAGVQGVGGTVLLPPRSTHALRPCAAHSHPPSPSPLPHEKRVCRSLCTPLGLSLCLVSRRRPRLPAVSWQPSGAAGAE